jgi:CDP-glycerol glycerophosphotransferase
MKIDRKRPKHWLYLLLFFVQALIALAIRLAVPRRAGGVVVVLYGHKLNGNLLAIHREMASARQGSQKAVFLTMDRDYQRQLTASGVSSCWACSVSAVRLLAGASAVVSDHGLHSLEPLQKLFQKRGLKFFDVWHGIPFKGFDADDFRLQHTYDEVWLASERCRELYIQQYGFSPQRLHVTGYARTDRLVRGEEDSVAIRRTLGLPLEGKLVLFAPTWAQDAQGRSLYPFGETAASFMGALSALAECHGATVLLRSHLNSGEMSAIGSPRVIALPGTRYPDAEAILLVSDVLICDWSSIAFDYLLLDRPAFFLDVEPPFRKGFSLGPEFRFGPVVKGLPALIEGLEMALSRPEEYWQVARATHQQVKHQVYGEVADGQATQRCLEQLRYHVG